MDTLPVEMLAVILEYVTVEDCMIPVCDLVCSEWRSLTPPLMTNPCVSAAAHNYLNLLKWFPESGSKDERVWDAALRSGHVEVLQWLQVQSGLEGHELSQDDLYDAAMYGNLRAVQWICTNFDQNNLSLDEYVMNCAIRSGNLELVHWLLQQVCPTNYETFRAALETKNLELVKLLHDTFDYELDEFAFQDAIWSGSTEIIQWMLDSGCEWYEDLFSDAIQTGNLQVVKYLYDKGLQTDPEGYYFAANATTPEMLQYLTSKGYVPGEDEYKLAAMHSQIAVLDWLYSQNYPGVDAVMSIGHPVTAEVLHWYSNKKS